MDESKLNYVQRRYLRWKVFWTLKENARLSTVAAASAADSGMNITHLSELWEYKKKIDRYIGEQKNIIYYKKATTVVKKTEERAKRREKEGRVFFFFLMFIGVYYLV